MYGRIEGRQRAAALPCARSTQQIRLRASPQSGLGELFDSLTSNESAICSIAETSAKGGTRIHAKANEDDRSPDWEAHIFMAILVHRQMYGAKGAAPNLLLDYVLVDAMLCRTVVLAVAVFGARVEGLLQRPIVSRRRNVKDARYQLTFTGFVVDAARRWCRSGLW